MVMCGIKTNSVVHTHEKIDEENIKVRYGFHSMALLFLSLELLESMFLGYFDASNLVFMCMSTWSCDWSFLSFLMCIRVLFLKLGVQDFKYDYVTLLKFRVLFCLLLFWN